MTRTRTGTRVVTTAAVIAGVFGLTACNSGTSVTSNSSSSSSSAPSPSSTLTSTPSSSSSDSSTSESSGTESSSSESSSSESSTSETSTGTSAAGGGATATSTTATMKFGDTLTVKDTDTTYALTVKDLKVAPESIYSEASLDRSKGTVYFIDFSVKAVDVSKSTYFGSNSVNGLFLKPFFESGRTGAQRLYGSTSGCTSSSTKLTDGQSADSCYIYQIPGAKISTVTYDDISTYHAIWK